MDFGAALVVLRAGKRVARNVGDDERVLHMRPFRQGESDISEPFIWEGQRVWNPSQSDVLAMNWRAYDESKNDR